MKFSGGEQMPDSGWREFYWYHCVDLGNGVVTEGDFDLRQHWSSYAFPDDMRGMRVLDVGRASGFFSFEFEKRGADVTATEIASGLNWDLQGGHGATERRRQEIPDIAAFDCQYVTGAFHYAHRVLGSKVRPVTTTVYELSPVMFGQPFDLVFAGSIMSHLKDPVGAMERLLEVTRERLIVAAPSASHLASRTMYLHGVYGADRGNWWSMSDDALTSLLVAAGFSRAEIVGHITLEGGPRRPDLQVPHTIVHAFP
jgi:tRNA (mo5U34)-methyltransferase